ncbi:MAG: type I phosphomannose isomerase catalytic subunit [Acidimicrobiales bacterium]
MTTLEPFLLTPSLAERVWGGTRLGPGIGEAWDLSVHPNGPATVASGPRAGTSLADLVASDPEAFGGPVDLLAKRLDCAQNLSVQVHPREGDPKTEAWVVLHAEPGAGVYLGFRDEVSREQVAGAALDGTLPDLLAFIEVAPGDAVFVPAGTVHAIGGGLVLFELQQSSDTTYRLYDWGREGRELHLDEGLACADLGPAARQDPPADGVEGLVPLVHCPFFRIDRVDPTSSDVRIDPGDRWSAVHLVEGRATLGSVVLGPGDTGVVPRSAGPVELRSDAGSVALAFGPPLT